MKYKNPIIVLIFFLIIVFKHSMGQPNDLAQTGATNAPKEDSVKEVLPEFPDGTNAMYAIIAKNIKYPESAIKDGIGGKVVVGFIIDTLGNVTDIEIVKGIRADLDREAMRVIGLLNGWTPGMQNNKKVRVHYVLPLSYTLSK